MLPCSDKVLNLQNWEKWVFYEISITFVCSFHWCGQNFHILSILEVKNISNFHKIDNLRKLVLIPKVAQKNWSISIFNKLLWIEYFLLNWFYKNPQTPQSFYFYCTVVTLTITNCLISPLILLVCRPGNLLNYSTKCYQNFVF